MNFTVVHSIPDYAEGGQPAESREREGHISKTVLSTVQLGPLK